MTTIELKSAPELKQLLAKALPGYRKTKVFLSTFGEHGISINSYWDGGSKSTYHVVDILTGQHKPLPTQTHPYFDIARAGIANTEDKHVAIDERGNVTLKHLPEGYALIQAGTFCGKPATAHLYLNPANMAKLLPA